MSGRWEITVPLPGVPLAEHRRLLPLLAELGYTGVWTAETNGVDAFTPLVLAAEHAPTLRLGTAIAPVYTRGPGLLAMTASALAQLAPGRFALGVGASSPVIVENWNAAAFDQPFQRTRDTLRFLRAALGGQKIDTAYDTFGVRGFALDPAPAEPPRILLAALRPGMLRLAGREADGAITNWLAVEDVPKVRAELGPKELAARIFVCPSEDAGAVRALGRRLIAAYLTVSVYAAFHDWLGRGEQLAPMHAAWAAGQRKEAAAAIPDEVVDALIVHGSYGRCREHVARYAAAGIDTPVLALVPLPGLDAERAVRELAPR
ncbi:LLM class F420-dependent oxidoreductase [Catellatospora sp. TT07R-123]|nr:LLM class F420-dependent oxidoreductase [Catellatospora sp. TT07R-123]